MSSCSVEEGLGGLVEAAEQTRVRLRTPSAGARALAGGRRPRDIAAERESLQLFPRDRLGHPRFSHIRGRRYHQPRGKKLPEHARNR